MSSVTITQTAKTTKKFSRKCLYSKKKITILNDHEEHSIVTTITTRLRSKDNINNRSELGTIDRNQEKFDRNMK